MRSRKSSVLEVTRSPAGSGESRESLRQTRSPGLPGRQAAIARSGRRRERSSPPSMTRRAAAQSRGNEEARREAAWATCLAAGRQR